MKFILLAALIAVSVFVAWRELAREVDDAQALPDGSSVDPGFRASMSTRPDLTDVDAEGNPIGAPDVRTPAGAVEPRAPGGAAVADPRDPQSAIPLDSELERLVRQRDELKAVLTELTAPILSQQVEDGSAEFLGPSAAYTTRKGDNATIFAIHRIPERGTFRSSISRDSRPDLYHLKDELLGLELSIDRLQRQLAQAGTPQPR